MYVTLKRTLFRVWCRYVSACRQATDELIITRATPRDMKEIILHGLIRLLTTRFHRAIAGARKLKSYCADCEAIIIRVCNTFRYELD